MNLAGPANWQRVKIKRLKKNKAFSVINFIFLSKIEMIRCFNLKPNFKEINNSDVNYQ